VCDEVAGDVPIDVLLEKVDQVHVMTSLSGFEALLRRRHVVVHGQPFYSGWGLTEDLDPVHRRRRRLSIDELVAATLILYPSYISSSTGSFTTPERILDEINESRRINGKSPHGWRRFSKNVKRRLLQLHSLSFRAKKG